MSFEYIPDTYCSMRVFATTLQKKLNSYGKYHYPLFVAIFFLSFLVVVVVSLTKLSIYSQVDQKKNDEEEEEIEQEGAVKIASLSGTFEDTFDDIN